MTGEDIEEALVGAIATHNPWWTDGADGLAASLPARQKSDFYHLVRPDDPSSQFTESGVVGLVGQHGVGKTTLLKQFVQHQLSEGMAPERFCYLPFDANALYQLHSPEQFERALRHYEGRVLGRLRDPEPHFLLLDDVHRIAHRDKPGVEGWGAVVKEALADELGRHVVVAAGATEQVTAELDRVGFEGSVDVQPILPEKFRDYIFTHYPDLEAGETRVTPTPVRSGDGSLPSALETSEVEPFVETVREQYERIADADAARQIQSEVVHYLTLGGVLSYVADGQGVDATTVDSDAYRLLYRNLTATLYQDAPSLESIRTIADLERLCALAARTRGAEPIRFQRLVDLFDVDRRTIRDRYLSVLQQLFVLTGVTEYDNQRPRSVRLFLRDTGLVTALSETTPAAVLDDRAYEADLARIAAFDHTMRLSYGIDAALGSASTPTVQYWQGRYGAVDCVFEVGKTPVPVALAYRPSERGQRVEALEEFRNSFETPIGLLVSGEASRSPDAVTLLDDGIVQIPFWLYLLLC